MWVVTPPASTCKSTSLKPQRDSSRDTPCYGECEEPHLPIYFPSLFFFCMRCNHWEGARTSLALAPNLDVPLALLRTDQEKHTSTKQQLVIALDGRKSRYHESMARCRKLTRLVLDYTCTEYGRDYRPQTAGTYEAFTKVRSCALDADDRASWYTV